MEIVVADTGPLNYLVLIDQSDLLPRMFDTIYIPQIVCAELTSAAAPSAVRNWIARPPVWLSIKPTPAIAAPSPKLDPGEEAALVLAAELKANLLLIDDQAGVKAARAQGFETTGTLGVLSRAAFAGLVDLRAALARLTTTSFYIRPELVDALLAQHAERKS